MRGGVLVHADQARRARIGVRVDVVVGVEVVVHGVRPAVGVPAAPFVQGAQGAVAFVGEELHAAEEGVAHHHAEGAQVLRHGGRLFLLDGGVLGGNGGGVFAGCQLLPLVHQGGIGLAHQLAEPLDDVVEFVGHGGIGDGVAQCLVRVGKVTQEHALGAFERVVLHEVVEAHCTFVHVAHNRLGARLKTRNPRRGLLVGRVRLIDELRQRLRVGDLVQLVHAFGVVHTVRLQLCRELVLRLAFLRVQHLVGGVQGCLDEGERVQRVAGGLGVQKLQRSDRKSGQRLVEGKVILQVLGQAQVGAVLVRGVGSLNHAAGQQLLVDADCLAQQLAAARGALVVLLNDAVRGNDRVFRAVHQVQQHRMGDVEGGGQRLRGGLYQLLEGLLGPANEAFRRLLALGGQGLVNALGVVAELRLCLRQQASVLNIVLGCLNHHGTGGIKTGAACASSDLVELAGTQTAATGTVKLRQRRNQHGTNRHVNTHTQGVGTANHLEQTLLSQLLNQAAVLGQHARVVNTDTGTHQLI